MKLSALGLGVGGDGLAQVISTHTHRMQDPENERRRAAVSDGRPHQIEYFQAPKALSNPMPASHRKTAIHRFIV